MGFFFFENMCIVEVKIKGVFLVYFFCIFWYGFYNLKMEIDLLNELENMFVFIVEISKKMELLFIFVGDFNL